MPLANNICVRCRRLGTQLSTKPLPGELGERILSTICQDCWKEWMTFSVKVINEYRLDFTKPGASEVYDAQLKQFFWGESAPSPEMPIDLSPPGFPK